VTWAGKAGVSFMPSGCRCRGTRVSGPDQTGRAAPVFRSLGLMGWALQIRRGGGPRCAAAASACERDQRPGGQSRQDSSSELQTSRGSSSEAHDHAPSVSTPPPSPPYHTTTLLPYCLSYSTVVQPQCSIPHRSRIEHRSMPASASSTSTSATLPMPMPCLPKLGIVLLGITTMQPTHKACLFVLTMALTRLAFLSHAAFFSSRYVRPIRSSGGKG
jgi:hypothetical protein